MPFDRILHVERTDINFSSRHSGWVDIRILVRNIGMDFSEPTIAELSAAPLGAFVPWRPLATVSVPALARDESFTVETRARRPRTRPLGPPDRVPPRQLLVALGADDDEDDPATRRARVSTRVKLARMLRPLNTFDLDPGAQEQTAGELPDDPLELLSRRNSHWAGNLNIFIGGRAVERHLAQALRVYPGRTNTAFFMVGSGRDSYSFHLEGAASQWQASLLNLNSAASLSCTGKDWLVPLNRWIELTGTAMMILSLVPPARCVEEKVEVHVKQRSTGETAIVEFSLDPNAAGPGCYSV